MACSCPCLIRASLRRTSASTASPPPWPSTLPRLSCAGFIRLSAVDISSCPSSFSAAALQVCCCWRRGAAGQQARSFPPSPRGRDIDPEPRRRPPRRRFVLHRTFGPRLRYALSSAAIATAAAVAVAAAIATAAAIGIAAAIATAAAIVVVAAAASPSCCVMLFGSWVPVLVVVLHERALQERRMQGKRWPFFFESMQCSKPHTPNPR